MKQIKLKSKLRQADSSLKRCQVGRLIRMLLGRADVLPSNALLIVLVCLMAIGVCCMGSGESANQLEPTGVNRETSNQRNNFNDKQSLLILLSALREFCSNNPLECQSDRSLDNCSIMGERLVCNQIASTMPPSGSSSTIRGNVGSDKTEQQSNSEMNRENRTTFSLDELAEGQFWLPKLAPVAAEFNIGLQDDQLAQAMKVRERISNMLARYETLGAATEASAAPTSRSWISGNQKKVNDKLKRNQEQHRNRAVNGRQVARSNTYRVTLDQANRLIRAHRRQQSGLLAPLTGPIMLAASPGSGDLLIVPKRTDSVSSSSLSSSDEIRPESGIRRAVSGENSAAIITKTSGHQSAQLDELKLTASSKPPDGGEASNNDDAIKCNMRHFIYRATKTDRAGNQCTGLITASICYGACDTGEIADWLFPHKKSIHKVCRHGRRIRRETRLTDCTTSSGSALALDYDELDNNLTQYHYVDALDCVCKRCTSADTTCLGTMSTPHLQTLGEIGQSNHNQNRHHQQQQPTMTSSGGGD